MAKGTRGGKRVASPMTSTPQSAPKATPANMSTAGANVNLNVQPQSSVNAPVVDPQNDVVQPTPDYNAAHINQKYLNILKRRGKSIDAFFNGTTQEREQMVLNAINATDIADHLSNSILQKFMAANNFNDKPQVVDTSTFNDIKGTSYYRTVDTIYDTKNDRNYSSQTILSQIMYGDQTRYSDSGGSAYGRALYFADDFNESKYYGTGSASSTMARFKFNDQAKIANYNQLDREVDNLIFGTRLTAQQKKLADVLCEVNMIDSKSLVPIYALIKGYDAYFDKSSGYMMVLSRKNMIFDKNVINPFKQKF